MTTGLAAEAGWRDHPRYPDPLIETLDPRFERYRIFSAAVERLYTGCRWSEGPVWLGDGRCLLWSDIPNNRIVKLAADGTFIKAWGRTGSENGEFRDPHALAMDSQGRLFVGDRANNRVVVLSADDFSVEGSVPAGNGVFHMWASPAVHQLWVNNDVDNTITVVDTHTLGVAGSGRHATTHVGIE